MNTQPEAVVIDPQKLGAPAWGSTNWLPGARSSVVPRRAAQIIRPVRMSMVCSRP